ncbi:MAG: hypothetical protein Q4F97_07105 [Bacteroidales bacterium]|nr:hypothetical protein [Bacteroidales bacterium]
MDKSGFSSHDYLFPRTFVNGNMVPIDGCIDIKYSPIPDTFRVIIHQ